MRFVETAPRVALVYPPYGPPHLPHLGLSLLCAGVKQLGFDCRVFYWNLELLTALPAPDLQAKLAMYEPLSNRGFFPLNEWAFARLLDPGRLADQDAQTAHLIRVLEKEHDCRKAGLSPADIIAFVRDHAEALVMSMADTLEPYHVVGINSTFIQNGPALALAKVVKERWPEKLTILGGANCEGEMGPALCEQYPFLDGVFSGEVDHSFPEFIHCLSQQRPLDHLPGIVFRDAQGTLIEGPRARPLQDLDSLPLPDFDDYVEARRRLAIDAELELCLSLESSRGCWWGAKQHCTFCGLNGLGMTYRQKSPARFQREVEAIAQKYGVHYLLMTDNILSMDYYKEFLDWARESGIKVEFFYEIKANVTREQMARLAQAGVTLIQPGIESLSSRILLLMRKGVRAIQNVALLKYAREYGVIVAYNHLGGFPGEDPAEYDKIASDIPMLVHLDPPYGVIELEYHRFSPYHNDPASFGIQLRPSPKYSVIYPFSQEVLSRLAFLFERADCESLTFPYLERMRQEIARWQEVYQPYPCVLTWTQDGEEIRIQDRRAGFPERDYRLREYAVPVFYALDSPRSLKAILRTADSVVTWSADGEKPPARVEPRVSGMAPVVGLEPLQYLSALSLTREYLEELAHYAASHRSLCSEEVISFTREEFERDSVGCLGPLLSAGLLYRDGESYLALPVAEGYQKAHLDWYHAGVL